jgi:hypothetical protein
VTEDESALLEEGSVLLEFELGILRLTLTFVAREEVKGMTVCLMSYGEECDCRLAVVGRYLSACGQIR